MKIKLMKQNAHKVAFFSFIFVFLITGIAFAEMSAYEIMKKVDERDDGETLISDLTMMFFDGEHLKKYLKTKGYRKKPDDGDTDFINFRVMRSFRKDFGEDAYSIIFFASPEELRNVSYLSKDYKDNSKKEDDNWLYLTTVPKPKRISGSKKKGSFMGSDFSYSDMNGIDLEDWNYKILKESFKVGGKDCWVIESTPKKDKRKKIEDEVGYVKMINWVRKDIFMTIRGRFYLDSKGKEYKVFKADGITKIQGIWSAKLLTMIKYAYKEPEHATYLRFDKQKYNAEIDSDKFTTDNMSKGL